MVSLLFTLQYYIANKHHPVSLNIGSDVVPECINSSCDINEIKEIIHRDTLIPQDIDAYIECTNVELYKIKVPPGVKCNVPSCHNVVTMMILMAFIIILRVH